MYHFLFQLTLKAKIRYTDLFTKSFVFLFFQTSPISSCSQDKLESRSLALLNNSAFIQHSNTLTVSFLEPVLQIKPFRTIC